MTHSTTRRLVAGVIAVVALAGCTTTVDGSATRTAGSVTSDGVDLEVLTTGNYPTTPYPAYGTAGSQEAGVRLEGLRLANNTVVPSDVDPTLIDYSIQSARVMDDAASIEPVILSYPDGTPNEMAAAAQAHNFVVGFASRRYASATNNGLTNAVLMFPDEGAAKAAAAEMLAADMREWPDSSSVPHPIPGHPDALAYTKTSTDGITVSSYTPRGRYVLYQTAFTSTIEASTSLVVGALDAQGPLIDAFVPTDPADYADLPIDPAGLLARTIAVEPSKALTSDNVAYEPAASLHFQNDPVRSQALYDEVGMVAVASGKVTTYETSQDDGGARVIEEFASEAVDAMGYEPAAGVMGMPNVQCFLFTFPISDGSMGSQYYCVGSTGRYAFEAASDQEADVHQLVAAEYLILTAQ